MSYSRPIATTMLALLFYLALSASAQEEKVALATKAEAETAQVEEAEPGCFSSTVKAVSDRPTVSSSTETTQCGVIEVLSGPERIWTGHGIHQDDLSEQLQFGLTPKLDLHYSRSGFFGFGSNPGQLTGQGDTFAGARYRFNKQSRLVPSFGTLYTLKVPTGSVAAGLSTGRYDQALSLLISKDEPGIHFDFNVTPFLAGRPDRAGYDKNTQLYSSPRSQCRGRSHSSPAASAQPSSMTPPSPTPLLRSA